VDGCDNGLDEWVEGTRQHLRAKAVAAAWDLVEQDLVEQRVDAALETARRARGLSPDDEQGVRRHMALLTRVGDPAAALRVYAEFATRLVREYDAEPSSETRTVAASLRRGLRPEPNTATAPWRAPIAAGYRTVARGTTQRGQGRRSTDARVEARPSRLFAMLFVLVLFLAALVASHGGSPSSRHLLLAEVTNHTRDSLLGVAVREALRTELSRVAEVRLARAGAAAGSGPPFGEVPRDGAAAIVTGDVASLGSGFTVSVRLVSAGSGRVLAALREDAADSKLLLPTVERLTRRLRGSVLLSLASAAGAPR
jgi:hypothetical protein